MLGFLDPTHLATDTQATEVTTSSPRSGSELYTQKGKIQFCATYLKRTVLIFRVSEPGGLLNPSHTDAALLVLADAQHGLLQPASA